MAVLLQFNTDPSWHSAKWDDSSDAHYLALERIGVENARKVIRKEKTLAQFQDEANRLNTLDSSYAFLALIQECDFQGNLQNSSNWLMSAVTSIERKLKPDKVPKRVAHGLFWATSIASPTKLNTEVAYRAWKSFKSPQALWSVARVLLAGPSAKDRSNAVSILEGLLRQDPSKKILYSELGLAYMQLGKLKEKEANFKNAIRAYENALPHLPKLEKERVQSIIRYLKSELS